MFPNMGFTKSTWKYINIYMYVCDVHITKFWDEFF